MHRIISPRLYDESSLFAPGISAGGLTFLSADARGARGQTGATPDPGGQTRQTLENLRHALRQVDQDLDNIVSLWILLTDYGRADEVIRVLDEYFPRPRLAYPAVSMLGVAGLDDGCVVRMDGVASDLRDRIQYSVPGVPLAKGSRCHGVRLGSLHFLSGIDADEEAVAGADLYAEMARQVNTILDRAEATLSSQGLALGDVFRNYNFLCRMQDPRAKAAHRETRLKRLGAVFGPEEFPAQTRVGIRNLGPHVLQRSAFIATSDRGKAYVSSDKVRRTPGVFSQSVRVGDWLFIAGQDSIGLDQKTIGAGDMERQTIECMAHVKDIVEAAGGALENVVKTTVYLLEGQDRAQFASTYQKFFKAHKRSPWMPAGALLVVDDLAADCLVEIDAVAYLGSGG